MNKLHTPKEKALIEALEGLILAIAPDYRIETQEQHFQKPLKYALEVLKQVDK